MKSNYIKQVYFNMRQDPLVSSINIFGTALSIFLIMLVVMLQQINVVPYSPESNRDRFLHTKFISWSMDADGKSVNNEPMSEATGKELYKSLKTPEAVTLYVSYCSSAVLSAPNVTSFVAKEKQTDADFWRVFDFNFIDGKPYDQAMFESGIRTVVVSENIARKLFGRIHISGQEIKLNHSTYKIIGVVRNVSQLASIAYGEIWIPYSATNARTMYGGDCLGGPFSATILAHSHDDLPKVKAEADKLLGLYNEKLKKNNYKIISHDRPYNQEKQSFSYYANEEPDLPLIHRQHFIIIAILLLVPAINLSSMTHSRLRRRISEIGIRRAFGCTRSELLLNILFENLVSSLIAGIIGLAICVVFSVTCTDLIFSQPTIGTDPVVTLSMLLSASTFLYAFFFCFILNFISSIIPAWRASRTNIVNALNGITH